jgi:hypothetical protein
LPPESCALTGTLTAHAPTQSLVGTEARDPYGCSLSRRLLESSPLAPIHPRYPGEAIARVPEEET